MGLFGTFKTGDLAPVSGVYRALHSTPHTLIQREICREGGRFPGCNMCPLGVLYRLESRCLSESSTGPREAGLLIASAVH
jgi:hypothetical protein